jgi:uncharacterized membrane protein
VESLQFIVQGTNGGVSWIGLLCSIISGLLIGISYYIAILYTVDAAVLQLAAPQWPIIVVAGFGSLFGNILGSILGETLQYSGNVKYNICCYVFLNQQKKISFYVFPDELSR